MSKNTSANDLDIYGRKSCSEKYVVDEYVRVKRQNDI